MLRRSHERASADHGWLKTHYTFSFADYHAPDFMGFGVLRVINEDMIAGGGGFPFHGHHDMEIITYVVAGALEHQDNLGNTAVIRPGDVQRMSAGTGVRHSEFNHFSDQLTKLLQIWILPDQKGYEPGYEQLSFLERRKHEDFILVASRGGRQGSVHLNQDVDLFACQSATVGEHKHVLKSAERCAWVQVVQGQVSVNGVELVAGDGLGLADVETLALRWQAGVDFLLFDMPQS